MQAQLGACDVQIVVVGGQALGFHVDLKHGQVGAGIVQQHGRRPLAAVRRDHHDLLGVLDVVVVGEDDAIGADDGAGAQGLLDAVLRHEHTISPSLA